MKYLTFYRHTISFYLSIILISFVFLVPTNFLYAEPNDGDASLHVISDKMIATQNASMVEFIGNVKATRLGSIVIADSLKVYFNEGSDDKNNPTNNNVKKIIATGRVEYTMEDKKAYSEKAVYTTIDEVLILTGNSPKLVTGKNFVTGKKITFYRKQDKVIVESDGINRVEAMFNPENSPTQNQQ